MRLLLRGFAEELEKLAVGAQIEQAPPPAGASAFGAPKPPALENLFGPGAQSKGLKGPPAAGPVAARPMAPQPVTTPTTLLETAEPA